MAKFSAERCTQKLRGCAWCPRQGAAERKERGARIFIMFIQLIFYCASTSTCLECRS